MQRRTRRTAFLCLLGASAFCFLYAWQGIEATRAGYEVEKLRREVRELESSNCYLRKDISLALSPASLEAKAQRLGMAYPEPHRITLLDDEGGERPRSAYWLARFFRRGPGKAM